MISKMVIAIAVLGATAQAARADQTVVQALQKRVALDAPSAERVQKVMDRYDGSIRDLRLQSSKSLHELRLLLRNETVDQKRVKRLADEVLANRVRMQKIQTERLHDVEKVLTPPQFGKLLVSWRAVNRTIRLERQKAIREGSLSPS